MKLKLIAVAVTALSIAGAGLYIWGLRAQNRALEAEMATWENAYTIAAQTAIDNQAALDQAARDRARVDALLSKREREKAAAQRAAATLSAALEELKREDPVVRDWSAARVPDAVRLRLEQSAPGAGPN